MTQIPEALAEALSSEYQLDRVIGIGGMATVYLADDVKHKRQVAVKVLKPELTASLGAERFLKEIELAARFTHPHIVPLHDSGEAGGFLYYVMPFIKGESLRARLTREIRFDVAGALEVLSKVADALGYAHREGIVHRDIKPENILFADHHPMVADFGIARAVSTAGGIELTRTGFPVGTPGYMSPEQAAGIRELDSRTDVYSLACVAYEMLVGNTPGMWLGEDAVRRGRFIDSSAEHRAVLDTLPAGIEAALAQALAVKPDDRFTSVGEFAAALRGVQVSPRQYNDAEVQAIVRHASEMETEYPTDGGALTIGTVREIADEVGIPPERIDRAARELEQRDPEPAPPVGAGTVFLGSPTVLRFERTIDGEIHESAYEELVEEIQATLGSVGQIGTLGRSLMWSTSHSGPGVGRAVQVRVTAKGGVTRIHVQERLSDMAGALFGGIMGGGGGGGTGIIIGVIGGALGAGAIAVPIAAGWVGGTYLLARGIFRYQVRQRSHELESLTDRLARIASEGMPAHLQGQRPPSALIE